MVVDLSNVNKSNNESGERSLRLNQNIFYCI